MSEPSPTYQPPPDEGLDIRYIDDALLVVDKPAGLLSVPGRGPGKQDCLSARVQARYPEALPAHRLDLGTSGLLVLARSPDMHRALNRLFETRRVEKRYVALVAGRMAAGEQVIDLPLIADWPNRPRQMVDHAIGKPDDRLPYVAFAERDQRAFFIRGAVDDGVFPVARLGDDFDVARHQLSHGAPPAQRRAWRPGAGPSE